MALKRRRAFLSFPNRHAGFEAAWLRRAVAERTSPCRCRGGRTAPRTLSPPPLPKRLPMDPASMQVTSVSRLTPSDFAIHFKVA